MLEHIPNIESTVQTPNEILAHQIIQALLDSRFITDLEEQEVMTLLMTGDAKAGDWCRLLENNVPITSSATSTDHATTHHPA